MKTKRLKLHWRGQFNYRHEVHILYCWAYTERQAWLIFCRKLADKHLVELRFVTAMFSGKEDNFSIEKVKEARDE